ncbi:MAG: hypothetical protein V4535_10185 [Bacteroidota bacterium]
MKKNLSILAILLAVIVSSCSNDSKSSTTEDISGQWKLVTVDGTFAGIHHTFPEGTITWDFNPITQMVTVTNNNTDSDLWDVLETGIYSYQFVSNPDLPCTESIEINGANYGCYSFVNDSLVIDQSIADGFTLKLKR